MKIKKILLKLSIIALLISSAYYAYYVFAFYHYEVEYRELFNEDENYVVIRGKGKFVYLRPIEVSDEYADEKEAFRNAITDYRLEVLRVQTMTAYFSTIFLILTLLINYSIKKETEQRK